MKQRNIVLENEEDMNQKTETTLKWTQEKSNLDSKEKFPWSSNEDNPIVVDLETSTQRVILGLRMSQFS